MAETEVPATAQAARDAVRTVAPALIEYTESVLYGDLWERQGLSPRDRRLATVAGRTAARVRAEKPT